ncbi:carbon-nitrogen hydrolase family protein [Paraferrimonas haliotis]|uniref:carbon-nitrogen hydrolase family protein n=1 Tax=Paraferrimonas haliotis TaxID=2013866 RepID=UPI000BA92CD1|nr:carbon-nitrogen hydrolase family protein [Paraferrimonas haliotis]
MSHFAIGGLQLELDTSDNLVKISDSIELTMRRFPWLNMLVVSELAVDGSNTAHAKSFPSAHEQHFCQLAKRLGVWLIPGTQFEKQGQKIFNTATVINSEGEVVTRYRKVFPFYPYEKDVSAGSEIIVFDVPQGRIGIAICYDLWFGEMARSMVQQGAEVIIYPTMTPTTDRNLELHMAIATAATNQCYVLSLNGAGKQGNGNSIAVGPEGQVIHQAQECEQVIPFEVDFKAVRRSRERGLMGLGQPLKSFRDNGIQFNSDSQVQRQTGALSELGPLTIPKK